MWPEWSMSRLAAETVAIEQVAARARAAGVTGATLKYAYSQTQRRCWVKCQRPVAEFLAAELRVAVLAANTAEQRAECAAGLSNLLIAMAVEDVSDATSTARSGLGS
jgi:hypothetical protein